ncbi:MAG: TonB-dependent siderophore receptor [Gammaproteobacteria bacterium]|nr:TonB-dependent siderophore receptor [Gammaproteobacteria bacterium]
MPKQYSPAKGSNAAAALIALVPLSAALSTVALAEEPERSEDKTTEVQAIVLPEMKITEKADAEGYRAIDSRVGTKTDTPLIETPQSISVVTNAQMEAQNVSNLAEALRYTPGIQSETFGFEPRLTFIKIRGFDATDTGVYRDGLKLSNPGFSVGYSLEPYGAERVEVPRGPVSVLYGQASPGGMVNYVTKRPVFDSFGQIRFEAGSFERLQGEVDVGGTIDERKTLAYRLTGLVRDSDTQIDFVEDNRIYVAPALTWKPTEDTTLTFLSHYQKDDTKASQRLPAEGTLRSNPNGEIPTDRFTGEPNVDGYQREEFSVAYLLEHRLNEAVTLRQNARYYSNEVDDRTIFPTALLGDRRTVSRALFESFGEVRGFTLDNQAQFEFTTGPLGHMLLSGVDFQHTDSESLQTFGAAPTLDLFNPVYGAPVASAATFKDELSTQDQIGLYLQDQIKVDEKWRVSLGGRYDFADSETTNRLTGVRTRQNDSEFTGRAGLVYLADNGLAPYFSYARSFLPVMGTDASGKTFVPETGEQYEFGVKYQPAGYNSFITVAYFDLTRKNFLTPDPMTFINVQRGEAHSRGVELEGVASLENGLNLTASYTYTDAEVTESSFAAEIGEPLEYAPEHKASLWTDYTIRTGIAQGLGFGGGVRFLGPSYGNSFAARNDIRIPGAVLVDAAVHYEWKNFQLAVNLHNALDKEYIATAFTSGGEFATFGPRRAVTGSIAYNF